ncbi:MAG: DUF1287 domain-containing protein [Ruminococcaceae bacterium]|nr:DUF1287 domain-containing protein [Oscillospiraceae bacterium]
MRRTITKIILVIAVVLCVVSLFVLDHFGLLPRKTYLAEDFGIKVLHSPVDYNGNGTDDYTDILLGARADAANHPTYDGSYYQGGYPPADIGVCTDVVWRAFRHAGYSLRDMVDRDVKARPEAYPGIKKPDNNIDFRRVSNLRVFFETYAVSLTVDIDDVAAWQPGDIVIFEKDKHIGIISDKRNNDGQPYVIHNGGQLKREQDYLHRSVVTGHYRFDASRVDEGVLVKWSEE